MLVAILALAAWAAVTPPQHGLNPPVPSDGKAQAQHESAPAQERRNTSTDKRRTEPAPLTVQITQPKSHEAVATQPQEESNWYANPDWWVAGFTGALFVATFGLWLATFLFWEATNRAVVDAGRGLEVAGQTLEHARTDSERQARDSRTSLRIAIRAANASRRAADAALANANAAQIQADIAERTLSNLEQPHPFVADIARIVKDDNGKRVIKFEVTNFGRSPAIIKEIAAVVTTVAELPNPVAYSGDGWRWTIFKVLGTQEKSPTYSCQVGDEFKTEEKKTPTGKLRTVPIVEEGKRAIFWVQVIYDDIFGSENTSGFVWEYETDRMVFVRPDSGAYGRMRGIPKAEE